MKTEHSHQRLSLFGKIIEQTTEKQIPLAVVEKKEDKNDHIVKTYIADSDDEGDII